MNKQRLFSNLECNGCKAILTQHIGAAFTNRISSLLSFLIYNSKRLLLIVVLFCSINCTIPETNNTPVPKIPITPNVDFVPSIRTRNAPPILAVNYLKTIGRTGQAPGEFLNPMGLIIDAYGQLYVADAGNNRVQVIDSNGHFVTELGSHGWREGEFDFPSDVALSFDTLYVADTGNNRVQFCNLLSRNFHPINTTTQDIQFDAPEGIGIGRNGEVFVVDTLNHRWIQFNRNHVSVMTMGRFGSSREQFWNPSDLAVNPHGTMYVVDTGNHSIKSFDFSGNPIRTWGEKGSGLGQLIEPKRITTDQWNYLYVTDSGNRRMQIFTDEGDVIIDFTINTLLNPCGIAVSDKGQVYVSDTDAGDIKVFNVIFKMNSTSDANKAE